MFGALPLFGFILAKAIEVDIDPDTATAVGSGAGGLVTVIGVLFTVRRYWNALVSSFKYAVMLAVVGSLMMSSWVVGRVVHNTRFEAKCSDYIMAAYKSENKERAKTYLAKAVSFLKESGRHEGYSAIYAGGQGDDLEEWCGDLEEIKNSLEEPVQTPVKAPAKASNKVEVVSASTSTGDDVAKVEEAKVETEAKATAKEESKEDEPEIPAWKKALQKKLGGNFIQMKNDKPIGLNCPSGISIAPFNAHYAGLLFGGIATLLLAGGWAGLVVHRRNHPLKSTVKCTACGNYH